MLDLIILRDVCCLFFLVLLPDGTSTLVMLAETMCNDGVILGVKLQGTRDIFCTMELLTSCSYDFLV